MRPHRRQPTRLRHPWDSPGKNTGVGCHFLLQCMKVKSESEVTESCPTLSLDSILKSRDITLPTKVYLVKAMVFESPLNFKGIKPVHPQGNQSWIFTVRTDAEAETPILWPPDANNWLIGKDPDAGKDWSLGDKGMTEMRSLPGITDSVDMSLSKLWQLVMDKEDCRAAVHGAPLSQTWLCDWTELIPELRSGFPYFLQF